jgi:hypothetical protein
MESIKGNRGVLYPPEEIQSKPPHFKYSFKFDLDRDRSDCIKITEYPGSRIIKVKIVFSDVKTLSAIIMGLDKKLLAHGTTDQGFGWNRECFSEEMNAYLGALLNPVAFALIARVETIVHAIPLPALLPQVSVPTFRLKPATRRTKIGVSFITEGELEGVAMKFIQSTNHPALKRGKKLHNFINNITSDAYSPEQIAIICGWLIENIV